MQFGTINSKQSMPGSISLLLWQDEVAASCQLLYEGNKRVGEKLLLDASALWKQQKAARRQSSDCGHFGLMEGKRTEQSEHIR